MKPNNSSKAEIWGLTGGIASGKSTAAQFFTELGIPVVDADQIAHELLQKPGHASSRVLERFGTTDRRALRGIVFSDPGAKKDLESILHPLIYEESLKKIDLLKKPFAPVLYEAALLIETGRYKKLAGLIVIDAPAAMRLNRLMARSQGKLDPDLAQQMISSQTSDADRKKAATFVIENHTTVEDLKQKIIQFATQQGWYSVS